MLEQQWCSAWTVFFFLFLDRHDKTHLSVSNAWISASGKMCRAVSYCNTLNGLVKLAPSLRADTGHSGHTTWTAWGGGGVVLSHWTTIGWSTRQKLSVNTARIYRQPVGMRQLFCVWVLDRPTLLPATFCSLIPIMPPWTGVETHREG